MTKRPKNKCGDCGNTWYPKGRDVSKKCPECGSENVKMASSFLGNLIGLLLILGAIYLCYWIYTTWS